MEFVAFGPEPPKDVQFCKKAPRIHFSDRYPTTAAGPTCHFPFEVHIDVPAGKIQVGPTPSSQLPTSSELGESMLSMVMSPKAVVRTTCVGSSASGCGCDTKSGITGRVMRFQSGVSATGKTG
jgi:hypothetical protein